MPELPEVQTIINDLNEKVKGDTVVDFWSDWGKAIKSSSVENFKKEIVNKKILSARRIGKNIFIDLSGGKTLYIHLKMTGHLLVKPNPELNSGKFPELSSGSSANYFAERVNQYVHHIFYLKSQKAKGKIANQNSKVAFDKTLEFSDLRKFGKIVLLNTSELDTYKDIKSLGVDAISPEFTYIKFSEILDRRGNAPVGLVLMDQSLIAGIGNIYRSEILFEAGVLPKRKVKELDETERKNVYVAIGKILKKAIKLRGTSDSDYRDTSGAPGNFQKVLRVYRREKQKCPKCGTMIRRETLGQRSVFFCPGCQK